MLSGKILYTPNNQLTREIIRESNRTFHDLDRIFSTVRAIVDSQKTLQQSMNGSEGLDKLNAPPSTKEWLTAIGSMDPKLVQLLLNTDADVSSFSEQLSLFTSPENQRLLSMLSSVADYADCISLDRFVGMDSEEEMEQKAADLNEDGEFIAGIVFMNVKSKTSRQKRDVAADLPKHIEYKIRMDIDNVETTILLQELYYSVAPRDNLLNDMRYLRGFIQIQEMVDRAIIKLHGGDNRYSDTTTRLQQMPATCYHQDEFMGFVYPYIIPVIMVLAWMFAVAHCIKTLTTYRESGLEELMKIMGLRHGVIWTSWFINTLLGMVFLSAIATIFMMVGKVLVLSDGFILFLFFVTFSLSTTMFCYMIGSFFTKANVAAAIGLMIYLISYMPYIIFTQFREQWIAPYYHASSILSTTAFAIGATYISRWEQIGEGVQWSNINKAPGYNEEHELSVQWMFIWMLIDSLIYFIIGWYVRNIIPGKFGFRQPFYFPFTKSYWGFGCGCGIEESTERNSKTSKSHKASGDGEDLPVGISINKLKKIYKNGKVAVNDLDMTFYEGQITAFLGRNGAGKTSTINLLTGMTTPTSGSAEVNGYAINSNGMNNIRQNLGYCPQFDMLFDFMTVKEHLHLFASLKSSEVSTVIDYDVEDMLHNIGLWSVRDELVGTLSGGMQRRLSVAIAFIGNSKVIILDEPTSSIDPHGRRVIWDVILKYRAGRTIILCTHHLDEADTLGDRVAILDKGRLRAEGSPMSLKKKHASGYQLFLEKAPSSQGPECDVDQVTVFIKQHCPEALLMTDIGSSLTYTLPSSALPTFDKLFSSLNDNLNSLRIAGFGVSDSTLYEVFEKITESQSDSSSHAAPSDGKPTRTSQENFGTSSPAGCGSVLSGLFRKRFLHSIKDLKTYVAMIILPCLFVALALGVSRLVPDRTDQPSLELQTSLYPNTYSFYSLGSKSNEIEDMSSTMFKYPGLGTVCMDGASDDKFTCENRQEQLTTVSTKYAELPTCQCTKTGHTCEGDEPMLDTFVTNTSDKLIHVREDYDVQDYLLSTHNQYKTNRYGGWTFDTQSNETVATVWFDNRAFHSSTSYMNALSNMILRAAMANIGAQSSEYGITVYNHPLTISAGQLSVRNALEKTADLGISLTFLVAFSFIPAGLCIYLVFEHIRGEKHLQYVSGVGAVRYWFITYAWDLLMFLLPIGLTLIIIYAFQVPSYSSPRNMFAIFLLFITYAWAVLPFMYMIVKVFKNTTTAFFTLLMVNLFIGIVLSTVVFLLNFFQLQEGVSESYAYCKKIFLIFPQYSFTSALIQLTMNQALVDVLSRFGEDIADNYAPLSSENGIYWNLVAMAVQGVVFFIITLMTEIKTTNCDDRISMRKREASELDDDVVDEKRRVLGQGQSGSLVVKGLSKQYRLQNFRHVLAVKDLTFAVQPGEIFGLCGVNGAGKTSTFKMLTGEIIPSEGSATLHGLDIASAKSRRQIGYCPQINSLDSLLTGRQVLNVYAQLKGISDIDQAIESIIASFGMKAYVDKQVKAMSGGMKRNLCVAVALLGNPDLIFLDEPSAGMDPVARRTVWNQILAAAARGSAIILTSHSMTECEALCSRLAIMLNGKLACLGSSQHLKNKFGLGYTLKAKVAGPLPHTMRVIDFIKTKWPGAVVKDQHLSTVEISIPQAGNQTLGSLFNTIEKERDNLYIEEYSVFQTTLDQVFIQFARSQQDQIEGGSEGDSESSMGSESTAYIRYNAAYSANPEDIVLEHGEKTTKTLQSLNGSTTWNTHL